MIRSVLLLGVALTAASPAFATEVKLGAHTFTVPDGVEIQLVAAPPLVERPMMADLDEEGRLYVADSAGVNKWGDALQASPPHRVLRLEDTDGDGRYDRSTVFADRLTFPQGALWYGGALYVASAPDIWRLEDTDGDGRADRRTRWASGFALTGCANDLHGPTLGPDGRFYFAKGGHRPIDVARPDGAPLRGAASHLFRARPDGREIEPLITAGMDNPVEVAFTAESDAIFSCTFYSHPREGKRDALVHALEGGVYPKTHPILDGARRTGELLPAMTHLGLAAPAGLARYRSGALGHGLRENLLSTQFNLRRVQRHAVVRAGSTFATRDADLLVSDNIDFHPTDVLEDADGSVLVVDTGGWFRICCPTSQIAKPEVLGGIYRLRRKGARPPADPRGARVDWAAPSPAIAALLGDPRFVVQQRAIETLARRADGVQVVEAVLARGRSVEARRNAVWTLARIDAPSALAPLRAALRDGSASVQQAALHALGLRRDPSAAPAMAALLRARGPHVGRAAATALGRGRARAAVPALLAAVARPVDRMFEHAVVHALIEIGDRQATAAGTSAASPHTRRAAMIALDGMGALEADAVFAALGGADPVVRPTALWIVDQHPTWGGEVARFYAPWVRESVLTPPRAQELERQLAAFARHPAVQTLVAEGLRDPRTARATRLLLVRAIGAAPVDALGAASASWAVALAAALDSGEADLRAAVVRAIRGKGDRTPAPVTSVLLRLSADTTAPADLRLDAIEALPPAALAALPRPVVAWLNERVHPAHPVLMRARAAELLGRAKLDDAQLSTLSAALAAAGTLELPKLLTPYAASTDASVGLRLASALETSRALAAVRPEQLRKAVARQPAPVRARVEALCRKLDSSGAEDRARLDALAAHLSRGDRLRGAALFNGARAACATCHQIGTRGGRVGPDLTKIGAIRGERDLLEAVVFPSASFARGYEPFAVVTKTGAVHAGVVREESSDGLRVVASATSEVQLARGDVASMQPETVSIMPSGWDQILTPQELADLVAFLRSLR